MIRLFLIFILWAGIASAQVGYDPDRSDLRDTRSGLEVTLGLSDITPYRVFTLDAPRRLIIDLQDVALTQSQAVALGTTDTATELRAGPLRPGWSRLVGGLSGPLAVTEAGMTGTEEGATLRVMLRETTQEDFARDSGLPPDPGWEAVTGYDRATAEALARSEDMIVVIDPGHGGIDPGAVEGGIREADLTLIMAAEVAVMLDALPRVQTVLTRTGDTYVSLSDRLTLAREVGADLFISLHADALEDPAVEGATVYTLAPDSSDAATRRIVERHERGDLLAGMDLQGVEDRVATALMSLARAETGPAARRFADALVAAMIREGVRMNENPRRAANFAVLTAPDFPSVLVEMGFLSHPQDRAVLATSEGRARIARAITDMVALLAR